MIDFGFWMEENSVLEEIRTVRDQHAQATRHFKIK